MRFGRIVLAARVEGELSHAAVPVTIAAVDGSESHRIAAPGVVRTPRRRLSRRNVAVVALVWVAVAGGALGIARTLDHEPAKPVTLVAAPPAGLPVLRLFLDRGLPKEISALTTGAAQAARLQQLASVSGDPALWVDLGAFAQRVGDLTFAQAAFRQALSIDPARLDARVGLLMVDGATGASGLKRAARGLAALEAANPASQLVAFNAGMVAIYREDRAEVRRAFGRAAALGASTSLGKLALRLASASAHTATP